MHDSLNSTIARLTIVIYEMKGGKFMKRCRVIETNRDAGTRTYGYALGGKAYNFIGPCSTREEALTEALVNVTVETEVYTCEFIELRLNKQDQIIDVDVLVEELLKFYEGTGELKVEEFLSEVDVKKKKALSNSLNGALIRWLDKNELQPNYSEAINIVRHDIEVKG